MQWQDVLLDKSLRDLPYKIELNERGKIEMSPASFLHSRLQGKLAGIFAAQLGGEVFTELAIATRKGVKVPDVAWGSDEYFQRHLNDICATAAPEICVEIISPSNTRDEMDEKIALFIGAGAIEVWLVQENGDINFYNSEGLQQETRFSIDIGQLSLV